MPANGSLFENNEIAYNNFLAIGYQPAQQSIHPDQLIKDGVIPPNLATAVMTEEDLGAGSLQYCQLTPKGIKLWQDAYAQFSSGS